MSDNPVRTWVRGQGRTWPFQEFMIRGRGEWAVEDVDFRGARAASATPEVLGAIATARAIVIGPSNPVISIGPILALHGVREALLDAAAPVVAVSPFVGGQVLKPATVPFMRWAGHELSADGVVESYRGLLDGLVADERPGGVPSLQTDVLMGDAAARRRLAEQTLTFAVGLR
jgi:LPPG:FO 2-phospho-L-lactate transferase